MMQKVFVKFKASSFHKVASLKDFNRVTVWWPTRRDQLQPN